jgi:UDP-galactopyranose mutase
MKYDYVIVGTGLFGSIFACEKTKQGKKCLVIDKRPHLGENCYTQSSEGINVHIYGAPIFHTSNKRVWDYMNSLMEFNRFTNSPIARYQDEMYNVPFNIKTFHQLWGGITPEETISFVGSDIHEKPINNYSFAGYKYYDMDDVVEMALQEALCPN